MPSYSIQELCKMTHKELIRREHLENIDAKILENILNYILPNSWKGRKQLIVKNMIDANFLKIDDDGIFEVIV